VPQRPGAGGGQPARPAGRGEAGRSALGGRHPSGAEERLTSLHRWLELWQRLGARPPAGLYEELIARYREPHRKYHTEQHLDECFAHFDSAPEHPAAVELALWFHDAIYDARRQDNEQQSADWARRIGPPEAADRVHALIMATRHDAVPSGRDAELLVDIDLSILGAAPERFDEYERQIRQEYSWVPAFVFRRKRGEILEGFLARPAIFNTERFFQKLETAARANLRRSLEQLKN
jgi:predicted metal-dependent HD superfamily phosphohydrolase